MTTFIIPANRDKYDSITAFNALNTVHWVQHSNKSVSVGDIIYIYESKPTQAIILKTKVVARDVYEYHIDDSKYSESEVDFSAKGPWFSLQLTENINNPISLDDLHKLGIKGNIQSLRRIDETIADNLDLISCFDDLTSSNFTEGKKLSFYSTRYERNAHNRQIALDYYGYNCQVCGFNFESTYGELGKEYIEVHHIVPLSTLDEEMNIDPTRDLVTVCSNCHRMIHRNKTNTLTINELKKLIIQKNTFNIY